MLCHQGRFPARIELLPVDSSQLELFPLDLLLGLLVDSSPLDLMAVLLFLLLDPRSLILPVRLVLRQQIPFTLLLHPQYLLPLIPPVVTHQEPLGHSPPIRHHFPLDYIPVAIQLDHSRLVHIRLGSIREPSILQGRTLAVSTPRAPVPPRRLKTAIPRTPPRWYPLPFHPTSSSRSTTSRTWRS